MKKILLFFFMILLVSGCQKEIKEEKVKEEPIEEAPVEEVAPAYQDLNTTPISFYQLQGNTLTKLSTVSGNYKALDDVGVFQIFFSNEESVVLNDSYANSYYNEWEKHPNIKVGFSLSFTLENGEEVFYNILTPSNTMDKWEYFMAYIYDDYLNRYNGWYSHIEPEEYNESTLFTAIKLQCGGYMNQIHSPVKFSVFTYDSEDDFLDGHYRGNSISTITICMNGLC